MQIDFKSILGENCRMNEALRYHTTFRVGGECRYFLTPETEEEIIRCMELIGKYGVPCCIIGKGSNILADDAGYDGVIISTEYLEGEPRLILPEYCNKASALSGHIAGEAGNLSGYQEELSNNCGDAVIEAGAGAGLDKISDFAAENSLTGLEFACGIPGSLGGAIVMNAGAYDGEMSEVLSEVKLLESDGSIVWKKCVDLELGYRKSNIAANREIVLAARLRLRKGVREDIRAKVEELNERRARKQPLEYPSAGSTFKRPKGYFAGKLIDDAGLRGYRLGGAAVSDKHCGFVINYDNASAGDIKALIRHIQDTVFEKFGVKLECEVRMI